MNLHIRAAARILRDDGVVAYPTEGVFGLGCLPNSVHAVSKLLVIKKRDICAGLILIAPNINLLGSWLAPSANELDCLNTRTDKPTTWVITARKDIPEWITGGRSTVAVRICKHPVANALCAAAGSALVSTSANISGRPPARNRYLLARQFNKQVDMIVPGPLGNAVRASEIRVAATGKVLRAG